MEVTVTLGLLDELQRLGFNDDAFWRLHHFRRVGRPDSIARHRNYCMGLKRGVFNPGSENERVALRLSFVLDTYRRSGLPSGETSAFIAFAEAAFWAIPSSQTMAEAGVDNRGFGAVRRFIGEKLGVFQRAK